MMTDKISKPEKNHDWRNFLLLSLIGLPITVILLICAYGFSIWFMQILFWGPPQ